MKDLRLRHGRQKVLVLKNRRNKEISNRLQVLELIESFYSNLYDSKINPSPETKNGLKRTKQNVNSEEIPPIKESEVEHGLKTSQNNKAPGSDGLLIEMFKKAAKTQSKKLQVCLTDA